MPPSTTTEMPASLAILRLSALGDVSHVLPLVHRIQKHAPGTDITWVIGSLEHRLLEGLPGVSFIVYDKKSGWPGVRALRRQLAGQRFDALLHMQVAARANALSLLFRADRRIGWDRARSRDLHHWFTNDRIAVARFQHQAEAFNSFGDALGLPAEPLRWNLPIPDEATNWARWQLEGTRPWMAISPASSHPLRNWRAERYAEIADHAQRELNLSVVLMGGPSDAEKRLAADIERHASQPLMNLVGQDTLKQSLALLQQVKILVSPDSGPAHLASALGTPVLGLYAATWSRRSGPYRSLDLTIDRFGEAARMFCRKEPEQLRWGTRIEKEGVMDLISVEDVAERLTDWAASNL